MTKLLTDMTRTERQKVANRLKQEARYRINIADELAQNDDNLRQTLRTWMFGPAAYSIEEIHRRVVNEQIEEAHR